jgi:DNA-directed RNA polymerase I subunit RPA2
VTIGMLVESMAGKAGACHATFQDSTPFRFCEGQRAVDFFGEQVCRNKFALALVDIIGTD